MNSFSFLKNKTIVFLLGPGKRRQYKDMRKITKYIHVLAREIPRDSYLLYFGDTPEKKRPDIGRVYEKLLQKRKDLQVFMLSLKENKKYGWPKFVTRYYFHTDHAKEGDCKYGGVDKNGKPCSNTKIWVKIHKQYGIFHVYKIGGGPIAEQEIKLVKQLKIRHTIFNVEHKF